MQDHDLREAGLKVTMPRVKILKILEEANPHHLSAEEVYKVLRDRDEDVGMATVYRVLTQFESAGLVIRHNFGGEHAVFELDHGQHHDHLVCVRCGKVAEFIDAEIEQLQSKIAEAHGFRMTEHQHIIYGVCEHCSNCQA